MAKSRKGKLFSPFFLLRRNALYKGLLGGSRGWLMVGGVFWTKSFIKRFAGKNEEIVAHEVLKPGQMVQIEAIPQSTRAQRRAVKRTS